MGEGSGMVGLVGTIHQLLKVIQQSVSAHSLRLGKRLWKQPQSRKRRSLGCGAQPFTQTGAGLLQKSLQLRIQGLG